jgi:hypothetical protein
MLLRFLFNPVAVYNFVYLSKMVSSTQKQMRKEWEVHTYLRRSRAWGLWRASWCGWTPAASWTGPLRPPRTAARSTRTPPDQSPPWTTTTELPLDCCCCLPPPRSTTTLLAVGYALASTSIRSTTCVCGSRRRVCSAGASLAGVARRGSSYIGGWMGHRSLIIKKQ